MAANANFCTLNSLTQTNSGTFKEGNLLFEHTSNAWRTTAGTMGMTTGKWYWEAYQHNDVSGNGFPQGIYDMDSGLFVDVQCSDYPGQSSSSFGTAYASYTNTGTYAKWYHNGSNGNLSSLSAGSSGDKWQMAFDADNGKLYIGKNGSWDNSGNPASGTNPQWTSIPSSTWVPITCSWNTGNSEDYPQNFGQDSTFAGRISAGGNADGNGYGDFQYAPPSGFLALCTANLPISEDIDPAETSTNYPAKNFNTVLYTGNGSNNHAISGLGFQPDMVWIQRRSGGTSYGNGILDSSRGAGLGLYPDRTDADTTFTSDFDSFDSDGFTVDAGSSMNINNSSSPFVAHCWKANGGTTSSNESGDITSTVQANQAAGFSIVTYSGSNSTGTIGHGLSKKPDFIITKNRSSAASWTVTHKNMNGGSEPANNGRIYLDSNGAYGVGSNLYDFSSFTNSVYAVNGGDVNLNNSGDNYIAYVWHGVEGMQKFGYYQGNGDADGPFIYTGGRPALVTTKRTDSTGSWLVHDNKRDTYNPVKEILLWDDSQAEFNGTNDRVDFLSNGFKVRSSNAGINGDGNDYIYMCWMDVPFKYSNTF